MKIVVVQVLVSNPDHLLNICSWVRIRMFLEIFSENSIFQIEIYARPRVTVEFVAFAFVKNLNYLAAPISLD